MILGGEGIKIYDYIEEKIIQKFETGRVLTGKKYADGFLIGNEEGKVIFLDSREKV